MIRPAVARNTVVTAHLQGQGAVTSPLRKQGVAGLSSIDRNFDPRLTAGASNGSPVTSDAVHTVRVFP